MTIDPHVIFLHGNDEYGIAQRVAELTPKFGDKTTAEMNSARLDAQTMTEDELHNAVNALPFLAELRLVVLENPSRRYAARRRARPNRGPSEPPEPSRDQAEVQTDDQAEAEAPTADAAEAEAQRRARERFLELLSNAPPTTKLLITETIPLQGKPYQSAAEKHWLVKWMRQHGLGLERLDLPANMSQWITKSVTDEKGKIDGAAASRLAEMIGDDPRQAAQEIAKLLTYVNWSRAITLADVEAVSATTAEPDVFKMVDALATGELGKAQRLLHRLLEAQDTFSTWGMILRQFRLLIVAREVLDGRGGEREALIAIRGIYPNAGEFVVSKALAQARRFTIGRLEVIYHKLLEIDLAAKTGVMPLDLGMDVFLAELPER